MNSSSHTAVNPSISVTTRLARCAAFLLLALFVILPVTHAQTTATLTGTVLDTSGAVVPNASITLTNEASNDTRVLTSNGDGNFVFPSLIPGSYSITVELKGFKTSKQVGVAVHAGDNIKVPNFALEVGDSATSVTVVENTQIIPVDNGERSAVLDAQDIDNLALESRNISELLKVLPGVSVTPRARSATPSASTAFRIAAAPASWRTALTSTIPVAIATRSPRSTRT
jgi:Carboxypeptidase regulatory-like domain